MKVRTLARLLEQANNWADGEDSVRNESEVQIARSERDYDYQTGDRGFGRRRKRPRRNFYDDRGPDMVAAGFPDDRDDKHRDDSGMQCRENQEEAPQTQKRDWNQGSRETTPEHTARLRNNSMDPARYTGSETSGENPDQGTPSET